MTAVCGHGRNHGRGLCHRCYEHHQRRGTLIDFARRMLDRDLVLTEYEMLRSDGVPPKFMPDRIGMSREAFERAMFRARKAGDPRAQTFAGMST